MEWLYDANGHRNIWLEDVDHGLAVQANQHVIVHNGEAMILDPGGHKAYKPTLAQLASVINLSDLRYLFLSHQDPDIVAAVNGWLLTTDAEAWVSELWVRFVPHFGLDKLVEGRLKGIPDEGMTLSLGGCDLKVLPAHFLHSVGNFQIYDPVSKILYSGDLGASLGAGEDFVSDFDKHLGFMEAFHKRYMTGNKAMRAWAHMVRDLEIEMIAPQHGAVFKGADMVERFIAWCEHLECGIDLMVDLYKAS